MPSSPANNLSTNERLGEMGLRRPPRLRLVSAYAFDSTCHHFVFHFFRMRVADSASPSIPSLDSFSR